MLVRPLPGFAIGFRSVHVVSLDQRAGASAPSGPVGKWSER
jgi:hypothetical protein